MHPRLSHPTLTRRAPTPEVSPSPHLPPKILDVNVSVTLFADLRRCGQPGVGVFQAVFAVVVVMAVITVVSATAIHVRAGDGMA